MKKLTTLATLTTLVAGAAGFVLLSGFAGGCGHHHPRDPAEVAAAVTAHVDDALDDLKATDAQRTQIHAVKDRMLAKALALHQAGEPLHQELLAQWNSPNPDRARLHALVDQQVDAMRAFAHDAVDAGADVHDVLTPEQRAQVTKKVERMHRWAR
jgi:Spy/CpxP family protein refolding chaperone